MIALVAATGPGSLALGVGGREVARELSAGRYLGGTYEAGQTITIDGVRGEIVALERAATVLRSDDGCTVRVPNHFLLESIITVNERPEDGRGAPEPPA